METKRLLYLFQAITDVIKFVSGAISISGLSLRLAPSGLVVGRTLLSGLSRGSVVVQFIKNYYHTNQ